MCIILTIKIKIVVILVKPELREEVQISSITSTSIDVSFHRDRSIWCFGIPLPLNYYINITGGKVVLIFTIFWIIT